MALSRAVVDFVNRNIGLIDQEDFERLFDEASYELSSSDMVLLLHMFLDAGIHVFENVSKEWAEHFAHENKYALREVGISVDDFTSGRIQFKAHLPHPETTPSEEERARQAAEKHYADYRAKKDAADRAYADKLAKAKAAAPSIKPESPKKKRVSPEEQLHKQMVDAYGRFDDLLKQWGLKYGFTTYILPYLRNLTNNDTELSFGFTLGDGDSLSYKKLGVAKYDQGEYKFDLSTLDAKVPAIKNRIAQEWAYSGIDSKLLK